MKRLVLVVALALTATAGWTVRPSALPAQPTDLAGPGSFLVCAGGEAGSGFDSNVAVASEVGGPAQVGLVGTELALGELVVDQGGGGELDLSEVGELGRVPVLLELPSAEAAASTVTRSGLSLRAAGCTPAPDESLVLAGGSTRTGEELRMMLANPFAGPAQVRVRASSELGLETAPGLEAVTVPASGFVEIDLTRLLPSRNSLTLRLVAEAGRVVAVGRQTGGDDVAGWEAIAGAVDWYLPVPEPAGAARLVVASVAVGRVDVRIDRIEAGGLEEALIEAEIEPGTHLDFSLGDLVSGSAGLRVAASDVVVPVLVFEDGEIRAIGNGTRLGTRWFVPGAGVPGADTLIWVLNPLDEPVRVTVTGLGEGATSRSIDVPALSLFAISGFPAPSTGVSVEAEAEVAVAWTAATDVAASYQAGVPLDG
jgi:hypothetical protein